MHFIKCEFQNLFLLYGTPTHQNLFILYIDCCKGYRPETSYMFILLSTGICLVLFYIYPIVPYAPEISHSSCYTKTVYIKNQLIVLLILLNCRVYRVRVCYCSLFRLQGTNTRASTLYPSALGLYGHWLAETRLENPSFIIENYMEHVSFIERFSNFFNLFDFPSL